ncbi:MAG: hypothetical protein FJY75_00520 [Candidatus Eisenbacteria bacterium]|uniref:Nuclear transport factor 2 family protein n=1 Tax=Eiseniibacteriota bacterium TaxID=2212470 RepID=A0A937X612_UNCEI|nr:hypothetical protein [Candidatus Eisenbacteria bacterium]
MKARLHPVARWAPLLLLPALAGCPFMPTKNDKPPDPVPVFQPRTSPENLLANLKTAYKERAVAEYESLLARDFTFVLSPEDAGQPGMPDAWGRNTEITVHQKMFDGDLVQSLSLDFMAGQRVFDPVDHYWTITISNVDLYLRGMTPDRPTLTTYRVQDGTSRFWFRQNSWNATGTNEPVWTIVKWEDSPIEQG